MQNTIDKFGPVVGRTLLGLLFLWSVLGKITSFAGTAGWMASKGLPMAEVLLTITIVIELGGALALIAGYKAKLGAAALFLWMIPVTLIFHNFWAVVPDQALTQKIMFMKNLAIMGGLLLIMAHGSGACSLDKKK
jgi:putative oxidoreductase